MHIRSNIQHTQSSQHSPHHSRRLHLHLSARSLLTSATIALTSALILLAVFVLQTPTRAHAACSPPATTYGTDTMTVSVPSTTTYTVWVNLQAPTAASNAILLQVDGGTCFNVGGSASIPLSTWTWVNYQNGSTSQVMQTSLTAGTHTLKLTGTEPGILVDNLLLLGDNTCIPTGSGVNCTPPIVPPPNTNPSTPGSSSVNPKVHLPTSALSASGSSLTPNNSQVQLTQPVTVNPTYMTGQTIKEVKYYLNKKLVYTATKAPFTYYLNTNKLENGTYVLETTTIYVSGESYSASETIVIKHSFLKNLYIVILNNLLFVIILVLFVATVVWLAIKYRQKIKEFIARYRGNHKHIDVQPLDPHIITPENHTH